MERKIEIKGPIVTNEAGSFYKWLCWDAAYPKLLQSELEEANGEDVIIEVNSNGGVATAGFEMYKIIKDYPGKVTVHLISAMSAASLITCAADRVLASDAAIFMIHNTQCYAEGDYRDMQTSAESLIEFNKSIINVYVRRTGKSSDELQMLMDNDTYMSPEVAIEYGFVDGYIYGNPKEREKEEGVSSQDMVVVNASTPIITETKAQEILFLLQKDNQAGVSSDGTDSNKNNQKGGTKNMTLEEFLQENPEAKEELDILLQKAEEDGAKAERKRLEDLDELCSSVTQEALHDAKYGEKPMDAKELAFQAMKNEKLRMASYMSQAIEDSKASNVDEVAAKPDEDAKNDADVIAGCVNRKRRKK